MGRPNRIKKRNSFRLSTKHSSFYGVLGLCMLIASVIGLAASILKSVDLRGNPDARYSVMAFMATILNVCGIISGVIGIREKDVYVLSSIVAIVGNALIIIGWIVVIILSF